MTIREIAERCGVSRGTVDRVLNGRGKVHPATEALILETLEQVGYTKNIAGRALTVRKDAPVIGVLLSSEGNPFFDDVLVGMRKAASELNDYNISLSLRTMRGYNTQQQLDLMDALAQDVAVLVLHPINDPRVADKVAALAENGIPTVTVNSDLENSRRLCYVGSDYERGGLAAAGIVRVATGGRARLGIITGVETILGHVQRLQGFKAHLRNFPDIQVAAQASAQDDIEHAYHAARDMLLADPSIDTLMVIAAGLEGVCRAVMDAGKGETMRVFAFDNIPATRDMMRQGMVKAAICQQPFQQGYQAIRTAFDIILSGKPNAERRIMENEIKILENLVED